MSGPYQSPGYPGQPEQWQGQGDFPAVQYGGLGGNWPEPPRRRNTGRMIVAIVSVLVIVGGVATGVVLLQKRHAKHQADQPSPGISAPAAGGSETQSSPDSDSDSDTASAPADPGAPNGSTNLTLAAGDCVSAQVDDDEQYRALTPEPCGSPDSDLILATTAPSMTGCANHQYLRLSSPSTGIDCFTLDLKQGDCVTSATYLKTSCAGASLMVLSTEDGPGGDNSCTAAKTATHWVPIGRDPVRVACLGPPTDS